MADTPFVGWAYRRKQKEEVDDAPWHLCKEEPTAHERRQPLFLLSDMSPIFARNEAMAKLIIAMCREKTFVVDMNGTQTLMDWDEAVHLHNTGQHDPNDPLSAALHCCFGNREVE